MKRILFALTILTLVPAQARSQATAERLELDRFVGQWALESAEGEPLRTEVCERLGTHFVRCTSGYTTDSGREFNILSVIGYDATMERYTWVRYWSNGGIDSHIGWRNGETWTWVQRDLYGGRFRLTEVVESENSVAFRWERSIEGGDWVVRNEGKATRVR